MLENSIRAKLFPHRQPKPEFPVFQATEPAAVPERDAAPAASGIVPIGEPAQDAERDAYNPPPVTNEIDGIGSERPNLIAPNQYDAPMPEPFQIPDFSGLARRSAVADEFDDAQKNYQRTADEPVKKQPAWKQSLFLALQIANKMFNPQDQTPIDFLGNTLHKNKLAKAESRFDRAQKMRDAELAMRQKQLGNIKTETDIRNINEDNRRADEQNAATNKWRTDETNRKLYDTQSRERTARMRTVAGMLKDLPSFDPSDPKFAEITQALGEAKLPLTAKDAKKKVELKQDQRTGAWEAILTDATGKIETRPVMQNDGTQLFTTPTVVMQGEYGLTRQENQNIFTAGENEKNRQQQRDQFLKNFNYKVERDAKNGILDKIKMKKDLSADLANGTLTQEDYDEMVQTVDKY